MRLPCLLYTSGLLMYGVLVGPITWLTNLLTTFLTSLSEGSRFIYGAALGSMATFDFGGPVNKDATAFANALYTDCLLYTSYSNLNVKIGATHGGILIGEDGASHQCIEDLALMRAIPGMTVVVPCDEFTVKPAVEAAILHKGPVYLRFGRTSSPAVHQLGVKFEIGKAIVVKEGSDVAVLAIGDLVYEALQAALILEKEGISAAVVDMSTVKPIDREIISHYAAKTGKILTAEDHNVLGGLGSAVSEVVAELGNAQVRRRCV